MTNRRNPRESTKQGLIKNVFGFPGIDEIAKKMGSTGSHEKNRNTCDCGIDGFARKKKMQIVDAGSTGSQEKKVK